MPSKKLLPQLGADVKFLYKSVGHTYSRPFSWQKKQWLAFGATMGGALLLSTLDRPNRRMFNSFRTPELDRLEKNVIDRFGRPRENYILTAGLYGLGLIFKNDWMRDTGIILIASLTASGLIQTYTKPLFGRARPENNFGHYHFRPFGGPSYHSLVSGHTVLATTTAWVLAHRVKPKALKIAFYTIGSVTSLSRIYADVHWLTDVGLGAALSIVCANTILKYYDEKPYKNPKITWQVLPTGQGIGLVGSFK